MSTYPMNPSKWRATAPSVADRLRVAKTNLQMILLATACEDPSMLGLEEVDVCVSIQDAALIALDAVQALDSLPPEVMNQDASWPEMPAASTVALVPRNGDKPSGEHDTETPSPLCAVTEDGGAA